MSTIVSNINELSRDQDIIFWDLDRTEGTCSSGKWSTSWYISIYKDFHSRTRHCDLRRWRNNQYINDAIDWLIRWLVDWLIDWLTDCFMWLIASDIQLTPRWFQTPGLITALVTPFHEPPLGKQLHTNLWLLVPASRLMVTPYGTIPLASASIHSSWCSSEAPF